MRSIIVNFVWTALNFCFFVCLLFCFAGKAQAASRIVQVESQETASGETINIQLSRASHYSHFVLHKPERIVVDIDDCVIPEVRLERQTNGALINMIRAGQNTKQKVRVVLVIKEDSNYFYSITPSGSPAPGIEIAVSGSPDTVIPENQENLSKKELEANAPEQQGGGSQSTPPAEEIPQPGTVDDQSENVQAAEVLDNDLQNTEDKDSASQDTMPQGALLDTGMPDDIFADTQQDEEPSNFSVGGKIQIRPILTIRDRDGVENRTSFRNKATVEGTYKDVILLSVRSDYIYFGQEDRTDDYDAEIYEAKWMVHGDHADLSLGKQIIRWGKTDQMSPVDTLNPEDLREFVIPDYEERKMPVWMADLTLRTDNFSVEGVFIPFFEKANMDYYKTNWSMFGHIKKEISNASIPDYLKSYFNNMAIHETQPSNEKEWGARIAATIASVDLGLTYHRANEDLPYISSFPIKNLKLTDGFSVDSLSAALSSVSPVDFTNEDIEIEYKRTNIFGFEFETTLSGLGVRGEAAWQENESFLTDSLTSQRFPTLFYIVGADYTTAGNIYLNLQFAHKHISGYDSSIMFYDQDTYSVIGKIQMDVYFHWLKACLEFSRNLSDNGAYYNPYLKYSYITNLECRAGAGFFSGDTDTWMGRFGNYDFVYFDIAWKF